MPIPKKQWTMVNGKYRKTQDLNKDQNVEVNDERVERL